MSEIGKKLAFLIVLVVYTFVVGMFGFKMGRDAGENRQPTAEQTSPSSASASSKEQTNLAAAADADLNIIVNLKPTLREITNMKGDPASDETRLYLERLNEERNKLAGLEQALRGDRNNEIYKGQADRIISALQKEAAILQDVEAVLRNPADNSAQEAINRVNTQVPLLISETAGMKINSLDLGYAFQLDDLASGLGVYVSRKRALDDAKRAEDERNAIREREKRQ